MAKYKIPVGIQTTASKCIGYVECDNITEFQEKAEELWDSQGNDYPTVNISNNFDLSDWELSKIDEVDLQYYPAT